MKNIAFIALMLLPAPAFAAGMFIQDGNSPSNMATVDSSGNLHVTATPSASSQPVSIDQTTPGTTNGVAIAPTNGSAAAIVPCLSQGASTLQCGTAAAKNLYTAYLTATADSWLMVFNSTSAPTNGATTAGTSSGNLQNCIKVPSGTSASIGGLPIPERFSAGVYFAISSTACSSLTLATTGLIHGMVN